MEWLTAHWFVIERICLLSGLFLTAYTIHKDERARQIGNMIAISARYGDIWQELYKRPELARVLKPNMDLDKEPVTDQEWLFVKMLIIHLDTVRRAMKAGMFVKIEGLQSDVREFFTLPIPKAVWRKSKPLQNQDFAAFIEDCLK